MAEMDRTTVPEPTAPSAQPRWARLASLGLILAACGPLLMLLAGLAWGLDVGDEVPFFGITAVIAFLGAFLVGRFGTWGKVGGIVAAVLVSGALFWTAFGLAAPTSFFDFMPGVLVMPGALIAIVSCVAALMAGKRAAPATGSDPEPRAIRVVLTAVVVLAVLSGALTFLSRSSVDEAEAADAAFTVTQSDFEFDEEQYQVAGGSQVLVENSDPFQHTFTIEELDVDVAIAPGSEELIEIPAEAGEYILFCRPHTSDPEDPTGDDMAATITVE